MSLPVILTPAANQAFESAAAWHEGRRGSAVAFVTRVEETLDLIGIMPEAQAIVHQDIRRGRVRRSAYNIYDRLLADRVEILAIVDGRRDASAWQSRV